MAHALPPPTHFYGDDDAVFALALHEPQGDRHVPERFVQDLWRTQRFLAQGLTTTSGRAVTVLAPGRHNHDTGPDFRDARLLLDGEEHLGDVEVHTTSGDWLAHRHHQDPRYDRVILHVTLFTDVWTGHLARSDGATLPEIDLLPLLPAALRRMVHDFHTRTDDAPACASRWGTVPEALRAGWVARLGRERLEARCREATVHCRREADLERVLYEFLFAGLGYAKNTGAMAALTRQVSLAQARGLPDPRDREALFLGAAGLLPAPADLLRSDRVTADYAIDLSDRWHRLRLLLGLEPLSRQEWLFFRLRPANFPTLRLAQGAAWFGGPEGLLTAGVLDRLWEILSTPRPLPVLRRLLRAHPGAFWETHYRLDRATRRRPALLGAERVDALLLNAVAPVLLALCDRRGAAQRARVFDLVATLPHRPDVVTRRYGALGSPPRNAFEAQGYHQLYKTRCREARCLDCALGIHLLGAAS